MKRCERCERLIDVSYDGCCEDCVDIVIQESRDQEVKENRGVLLPNHMYLGNEKLYCDGCSTDRRQEIFAFIEDQKTYIESECCKCGLIKRQEVNVSVSRV
jgi:hypothetical protein